MTDFGIGNYPPGVTGNELQIAGPDYERESEVPCAKCRGPQMYWTYGEQAHVTCQDCEETTDLNLDQDDPDAEIKEEHRERLVSTYLDAVYEEEREHPAAYLHWASGEYWTWPHPLRPIQFHMLGWILRQAWGGDRPSYIEPYPEMCQRCDGKGSLPMFVTRDMAIDAGDIEMQGQEIATTSCLSCNGEGATWT